MLGPFLPSVEAEEVQVSAGLLQISHIPWGLIINDGINPDLSSLTYTSVHLVVEVVAALLLPGTLVYIKSARLGPPAGPPLPSHAMGWSCLYVQCLRYLMLLVPSLVRSSLYLPLTR